jgi:murein DD-endopeptidase MepM/ murein hydrolase activator NlpD
VRHEVEGLEIYSLYGHLREIRAGLKAGQPVRAGETLAVMGRTSNTHQGISRERAHVHFELNFLLNDRFAAWQKATHPTERNDHGEWNGLNLLGIDPRTVLTAQQAQAGKFSLVNHIRHQPELCRVLVRGTTFPWLKRYAPLILPSQRTGKEELAGYEIALNFNGLPFQLTPRNASEIHGKTRFQLLSVNEAEQQKNPCRRLVTKRGSRWELTGHGLQLLELLTY